MTRPTATTTDVPPPPAPPESAAGIKNLAQTNGQGGPTHAVPTRVPKAQHWSVQKKLLIVAGAILVVAGVFGTYLFVANPFRRVRTDLVTHKVRAEQLELTIVERGALESAKNSDIYCNVKAGTRGANNATNIKWLIDDGSQVKKGDRLITLDDSGLQDQLKTEKITLDKNEADKIKAEEAYNIQLSQNESDIATAKVNLQLAKIDLEKYQEGDYPQAFNDVSGRIKVAEGDLEQQRDRTAWANRMVKKGYYTVTQAQAEQSKLESYELALKKVKEEKEVLTNEKYGLKKRTETDLDNKVKEAERALDRVLKQAKAKEVQARSDREANKSVYLQQLQKCKDLDEEIRKCTIIAPQDGMVVYYVPEQARGGSGAQQAIIAQGEPVREGQKLMQIPDLRRMLVNTKVHEALVSRVRPGQRALIKIDSFPDRIFHGHIETVATVSAQQDFMAADVKVYTTKVRIEDVVDGLKPGMSAEVTVTVGDTLPDVLAVPIQAIVGSNEMGRHRIVVLTPNGPEERDVLVGQSNNRMAEIKEGLSDGEEVVLNPKAVLGDKIKTRQQGEKKGASDTGKPGDKPQKPAGPDKGGDVGANPNAPPKAQLSPEERQKRMQEKIDKYRQASPAERKQMFEQENPKYRDRVKEMLDQQNIKIE
jgi:multidrug efflux pump subunit AcrA (membrane-fusion protein)